MSMDQARFLALVNQMEQLAKETPSAYKRRVFGLALLGYGYLVVVGLVLLVLLAGAVVTIRYAAMAGMRKNDQMEPGQRRQAARVPCEREPMNPVIKALWYIEHHFAQELSLDDIAAMAGVSRFHLSRAFSMATGYSVMGYVRGRRLTEAARALSDGAPDILAVALEAGYGSHEAFTRAFREQFGVTPEALRANRGLQIIQLVEPIRMDTVNTSKLDRPRIVEHGAILLAGLSERLDCNNGAGIPAMWQRFAKYVGHVPRQIGLATYGVTYNTDEAGNMEYMCGVQVADFSDVPPELSRLRLSDQRYAVFMHRGHISAIRSSWVAALTEGLPEAGLQAADAPAFERYDDAFDPRTGNGSIEIWIPIKQ